MKKIVEKSFVIICFIIISAVGALIPLSPHEEFCEIENRRLKSSMELSLDGFSEDLSEFYSDQFPMRRRFTDLKAELELLLGRGGNNGVILGEDGYLVLAPEYSDLTIYEKNLRALSEFSEKYRATVYFAPRGADILTSKLPRGYSDGLDKLTFSMARERIEGLIDSREKLRDASEAEKEVWFRTDHHWTQLGAYTAYCDVMERFGKEPTAELGEPMLVSDSFLGSVYSRLGRDEAAEDRIYTYISGDGYRIVNYDTGDTGASLYSEDKLLTKDKYRYFGGGNHGHLGVYREGEKRESLLIIKDSFANCALPFFAADYDLEVYDLRYFAGSISAEIERIRPHRILVLYGIDTAVTDGSLSALCR